MEGSRTKLTEVNPHLVCVLCHGYFVDATTIAECLHSFCRSCIFRQLERKSICPICEVQVHNTKLHLSLRPDKTLQDIVYKLVPGLFHNEMQRRRDFYKKHPHRDEHLESECRGVGLDRLIYSPDDLISLSLEFYDEEREREEWSNNNTSPRQTTNQSTTQETNNNGTKRYLQCPAGFKMAHLKKFIRQKYGLAPSCSIEIMYRRESLPDSYSLMDIAYIYTWKRNGPMRFYYRIPEVIHKQIMAPLEAANNKIAAETVVSKNTASTPIKSVSATNNDEYNVKKEKDEHRGVANRNGEDIVNKLEEKKKLKKEDKSNQEESKIGGGDKSSDNVVTKEGSVADKVVKMTVQEEKKKIEEDTKLIKNEEKSMLTKNCNNNNNNKKLDGNDRLLNDKKMTANEGKQQLTCVNGHGKTVASHIASSAPSQQTQKTTCTNSGNGLVPVTNNNVSGKEVILNMSNGDSFTITTTITQPVSGTNTTTTTTTTTSATNTNIPNNNNSVSTTTNKKLTNYMNSPIHHATNTANNKQGPKQMTWQKVKNNKMMAAAAVAAAAAATQTLAENNKLNRTSNGNCGVVNNLVDLNNRVPLYNNGNSNTTRAGQITTTGSGRKVPIVPGGVMSKTGPTLDQRLQQLYRNRQHHNTSAVGNINKQTTTTAAVAAAQQQQQQHQKALQQQMQNQVMLNINNGGGSLTISAQPILAATNTGQLAMGNNSPQHQQQHLQQTLQHLGPGFVLAAAAPPASALSPSNHQQHNQHLHHHLQPVSNAMVTTSSFLHSTKSPTLTHNNLSQLQHQMLGTQMISTANQTGENPMVVNNNSTVTVTQPIQMHSNISNAQPLGSPVASQQAHTGSNNVGGNLMKSTMTHTQQVTQKNLSGQRLNNCNSNNHNNNNMLLMGENNNTKQHHIKENGIHQNSTNSRMSSYNSNNRMYGMGATKKGHGTSGSHHHGTSGSSMLNSKMITTLDQRLQQLYKSNRQNQAQNNSKLVDQQHQSQQEQLQQTGSTITGTASPPKQESRLASWLNTRFPPQNKSVTSTGTTTNTNTTTATTNTVNVATTTAAIATTATQRVKSPKLDETVKKETDTKRKETDVAKVGKEMSMLKRKLDELRRTQEGCEITQENPNPEEVKKRRDLTPDVSIELMRASDMKKVETTTVGKVLKEKSTGPKRPVPGLKCIQDANLPKRKLSTTAQGNNNNQNTDDDKLGKRMKMTSPSLVNSMSSQTSSQAQSQAIGPTTTTTSAPATDVTTTVTSSTTTSTPISTGSTPPINNNVSTPPVKEEELAALDLSGSTSVSSVAATSTTAATSTDTTSNNAKTPLMVSTSSTTTTATVTTTATTTSTVTNTNPVITTSLSDRLPSPMRKQKTATPSPPPPVLSQPPQLQWMVNRHAFMPRSS